MRTRKAVAAIVAASFMMIGLGATSAVATEPDTPDPEVVNDTTYGANVDVGSVRIVDRTFESMPIQATAARTLPSTGLTTEAYVPIPLPPGFELAVGETVQVNYSDGVVTQQAIALACTSTSSVGNPYVTSGQARSSHSHGLSSGCAAKASVNGILSSYAAPWWHQRDFETVTVNPDYTVYWVTSRACVNSGTTTWHSENAIGSSVTALSPNVNLACNPG